MQNAPFFTKLFGEFVTFQWADRVVGPYETSWSSGIYFNLVYRLFPHRARGNIPEQGLYRGLVAKKRAAWYNICYKFGTDERKRS